MTSSNNHELLCNGLHQGAVLCVGNALLDVTFFGDRKFLDDHGLNENDACIISEERYRTIHAALEDRFKSESYVPGGASQNTARATQWLLHEHPGSVTYMGAIAKDNMGSILKDKAKEAGVNGIYQIVEDGTPTGCCLVIVSNHHRSLAAHLGAALTFKTEHVKKNWEAVEKANYIYIEGFFLSTNLETCLTLSKHVAEHPQKRFLLNLSAEFVTTLHKHMLLEVMPYVDILFGNDTEALSFAREMNFGTDIEKVASAIAGMEKNRKDRKRIVVITCGSKPVVVAIGPDKIITSAVDQLKEEQIIDTNGAGDAFVGGFLAQLITGKPLEQCVRTGSYMASIVIQRLGCTFPSEKPDLGKLCH